jgi:hypothetical protein
VHHHLRSCTENLSLPQTPQKRSIIQQALVKCDRQQTQQMGQVARTIAEQHSWANMAGNYVNLFEELQPC